MRTRLALIVLVATGVLLTGSTAALGAERADRRLVWRGIVEGPYGRPWTHAERIDVLRWMSRHGMNAYVHAPKDDLYQRTNWRDPYPVREMREFEREIRLARRRAIDWIPNLSPALPLIPTPAVPSQPPSRDLCFSCPSDLEAVVAKLHPFLAAGARTVMISFDDVTKALTHTEDLAAYGAGDRAFGKANGDFLTRLRARLRERWPGARLLTVGADYSGTADTEYLAGLRATLGGGIEVMWTGTGVPSEHWTPADARAYGERIGRTAVVWDNWTNNDTAGNATPFGTARIFLGPYLRRPSAARSVRGFFFNPANEAYLNLLPLATAADWMHDPRRYRARRSWLHAVRELAPGRHRSARRRRSSLRAWAEASWSNKLDREREAPGFVRKSSAFLRRYEADGRWPPTLRRLLRELRLVERAPERLLRLPEPGIAAQGAEFLDAARRTARSGALAARLLAAERPLLTIKRTARGYRGRAAPPDPGEASMLRDEMRAASLAAQADSEFTYGWRTPFAFEIPPYPVPGNVMDAFVDRAGTIDSAWQPRADQAAAEVTVSLAGEAVPLDAAGRFRLPRRACGLLAATDGAGGRTAVRLRRCRIAATDE